MEVENKNSAELIKVSNEIPKAELHVHIEGTFEPELIFKIAERNHIRLPYASQEELRQKYKFGNLQEFLDVYYQACAVLINEQDFSDLLYAYVSKASSQGLRYAEVFFDPQSHLPREVGYPTIINGLKDGVKRAKSDFNVEVKLIMCFLRHLDEKKAIETFQQALAFKEDLIGIGLASSEMGNPPEKFKRVFDMVREQGLRICAHAGEEGPVDYIKQAVEVLKAERIDHGIAIENDDDLLELYAERRIPFTVCPLSNQKLQVKPDLTKLPLRKFIDKGLLVMLNSDDPAYFGGYIGDNYTAMVKAADLSLKDLVLLAKNSFDATFLPNEEKEKYKILVDEYLQQNNLTQL